MAKSPMDRAPLPFRAARGIRHDLLGLAVMAAAAVAGGPAEAGSAHADYVYRCSGCHGLDGAGWAPAGIPPFPGLVGAFAADTDGRTYLLHVPGVVGSGLDDRRIAAVLNYVLDAWAESDGAESDGADGHAGAGDRADNGAADGQGVGAQPARPGPVFRPFDADEVRRLRAIPVADVVAFRRAVVRRLTAEGVAVADYPWP